MDHIDKEYISFPYWISLLLLGFGFFGVLEELGLGVFFAIYGVFY